MNRKLEDLALGLFRLNAADRPEDIAFVYRNPLRLAVFENGVNTGKLRKFNSFHSGWVAGINDLHVKCSGKSRAKLKGEDFTLQGLIRVFSLPDGTAKSLAFWLRKALRDPSISEQTRLDYFLEDTNGRPSTNT